MACRIFALICTLLAGLAATGCKGPELHDSVDLELDFELTPSDELHLPYVVGAQVSITATDGGDDNEESRTWTLAGTDPSVLRIDSQSEGTARCTAVGPGVTTIAVLDRNGELIHEAEIEVAVPDRATVHPHGLMIIGVEAPLAHPELTILSGGTATLMVQYWRGDQRLYGHGALTATASGDLTALPQQTFLFEDRDWLQLTPASEGDQTVDLSAGGFPIGSLTVHAVGRDAIAEIDLVHEFDVDFDDLESGDSLTVLGLARGDDGEFIYGVELSWDIDGNGEPGLGDLFRYTYEPDTYATLGGELDDLRAEIEIRGREGYVDSSNNLGCSLGGSGRPPHHMAYLAALGLALALLRRRPTNKTANCFGR